MKLPTRNRSPRNDNIVAAAAHLAGLLDASVFFLSLGRLTSSYRADVLFSAGADNKLDEEAANLNQQPQSSMSWMAADAKIKQMNKDARK